MRFAVLFIPHFPVQVETGADTGISGKAVVIGGYPHERKLVFDASKDAVEHGIQAGMTLRQAYGLCPEALFLPLIEEKYRHVFESILDKISDFIPKVEAGVLGEIFLEIPFDSWEECLIPDIRKVMKEQFGLSMSFGSASARFPAQAASRIARTDEIIAVPKGKELTFLSNLPIDFLPGSGSVLRRLELLGIHKMGQLAGLPRHEVSLQFGMEGEKLWQLARGIDNSKVLPRRKIPVLAECLEFEPPAETFSHLLAGAEILTDRLGRHLDNRWQHCSRMTTLLIFADNTLEIVIDFKLATSSAEDMLRHLRQRLDSIQFSGPVTQIRITAENLCAERSSQLKLLDDLPRCSESLLTAIRQLQAKYGSSIVKRSVLPKTFSRLPEGAFALVDFG